MSDYAARLSPDDQMLSAAAKALIRAAGGLEAAAEATGVSKSTLHRYSSVTCAEQMPVHVVAALEAVTHGSADHPQVTRVLARRAGYTLYRRAEDSDPCADLLGQLAVQAKESGDIANQVCLAIRDGAVEPGEAAAIIREIDDLELVLAEMRAGLDRIAAGTGR